MARTISVPIVSVVCHILNMGNIDSNSSCSFFWSIVNFIISLHFRHLLLSQNCTKKFIRHDLIETLGHPTFCNGSCETGLSVINMTNSTNVTVRLVSLENLFF